MTMLKTAVGVLVSATIGIGLTSGCYGGCYTRMEAIKLDPPTECLALHRGSGSEDDDLACGYPDIGGTNNCSEPLTLPKMSASGEPRVIAPGEKFWFPLLGESVPPDYTVVGNSEAHLYTVVATLGTERITLTMRTHETE